MVMSKGNKQTNRRKKDNRRKKEFLKVAEKGERSLEEKMLEHVRSTGYAHCESECAHVGYESG